MRGVSTGVSQYGQICQSGSSGALQRRHACFSFVVQTGQTRNESSTSARQTGQRSLAVQALLHRLDLELALAHVLDVLGRPEEHVDERPEERRDDARGRRPSRGARVLDPAARVLVDPERRREPEDDDEEDRDVPDEEPDLGVEEVA